MKKLKQLASAALSLGLLVSTLSGCGNNPASSAAGDEQAARFPAGTTVLGIALSGGEDAAAEQLKQTLENAGYGVVLSYAEGDSNTQISQLNDLVESGSSIVVLDAVDTAAVEQWFSSQSTSGSAAAGSSGAEGEIPFQVIACGAYLSGDAVAAYIGPDYKAMGIAQGEYLLTALKLNSENPPSNALTVEFVAGSTEEERLIFEGAMEVLSPYLTEGKLVVPSGNDTYEAVSAQGAAAYISSLLTTTYSANDLEIDAIVTTGGSGVEAVMEEMQALYTGSVYPIITGAQCDLVSAEYMRSGFLSMTTVSDPLPEDWAEQAAALVQQLDAGEAVSDVLTAVGTVTRENFDEMLIETGLYAYDDTDALVEGDGVPLSGEDGDADGAPDDTGDGGDADAEE